ncbi:hypothetical protein ACA097_04230 [Pseudomonas sp. QL9]|uniref:hypothetical protein n=1 Tax=Pseudomonas sp. QL9 TaxID=3242725 RepID=UPI00352B99F2
MNPPLLITTHDARVTHLRQRQEHQLQRARQAIPAPYVAQLRNDGSLPDALRQADQPVRIASSAGLLQPGDGYQLLWDDEPVGLVRPLDGNERYPLEMRLPRTCLEQDGPHELSYRIVGASGSSQRSVALPIVLATSSNEPDPYPELDVDQEVTEIGVTLDYLAKHQDHLKLKVPTPARLATCQQVELYWRTASFGMVVAARCEITSAHRSGSPIEIAIEGAFIRQHADSSAELSYAFVDAIGQRSRESQLRSIALYLTPLPRTLPEPRVPLADDPIGIDLADLQCGVRVEIPFIADARSGDRILVCWGQERLPEVTLGDPTASGFPLWVEVPSLTLGRLGSGRFKVFYELHCGEIVLTSSALFVSVDIETVGPSPHEPHARVNDALLPATLRGALSGYDNEITPADVDRPVSVAVPFYEGAREDDIIRLYWGEQERPAAEYRVQRQDLEQRLFAPIGIDWVRVASEGNGAAVALRYGVSAGDNGNETRSPATQVNVHFALPGGPVLSSEIEFPERNERGWLVPASPCGTTVRVPAYRNMAIGDAVEVRWLGLDGTAGGDAGSRLQRIVEEADLGEGMELQLDLLGGEPIIHGIAAVQYQVTRDDIVFRGPRSLVLVDVREAIRH